MATKKSSKKSGGAKKGGGKSSAKKSAAKKSSAKKGTSKKSAAKKGSAKKGASKKSSGRKGGAKKSSSRKGGKTVVSKVKKVAGDVLLGAAEGALVGAVKVGVQSVQDVTGVQAEPPDTAQGGPKSGGGKKVSKGSK